MRLILVVVFFGFAAKYSYCQCAKEPKLSIISNTISVSGEVVHLSGTLPMNSQRWFFFATCQSTRLFNFSLWTIEKFADRDGYYRATSWNLQVLDSHDYPEKELIFDRENRFYFRGDVHNENGVEQLRIDAIEGLPKELHGSIVLREVPSVH